MNTHGRHFLAEYWGCKAHGLDDVARIEALMERAAIAADANIVQSAFHRFSPQGVSGVVVVEESHLSIHTWPEDGYAAVDIYTCGDCSPEAAHHVLLEGLGATRHELLVVHRGARAPSSSMRVKKHVSTGSKTAAPMDSAAGGVA